jgi:hypothetical protein
VFIGKRIFNPKFKTISILIMVIGVFQIIDAANSESSENRNRITITENYADINKYHVKHFTLEDNLSFDISLDIIYSVEHNKYIPIESYSHVSGLIMGHTWDFKSIVTNIYEPERGTQYYVTGTLKWQFFGFDIYNEHKTFNGTIE